MAFETGTATDYQDLLQKLKNFLTGANSPTSGLSWQVVDEKSPYTSPLSGVLPDDVDTLTPDAVASTEIIFKGNGGVSPEKEIYFGVSTYQQSISSIYNWQVRGFTGYLNTSPETSFYSQPGISPPAYIPLSNTTITYWFFGTERRVVMVAKVGTSYMSMYAGFLNPFATDSQYPYPMLIAGTVYGEGFNASSNSIGMTGIIHPSSIQSSEYDDAVIPGTVYPGNESSAWVRWTDGVWKAWKHFQTGSTESNIGATEPHLMSSFPLGDVSENNYASVRRPGSDQQIGQDYRSTTAGGTPSFRMNPGLGSPEYTALWPVTVVYPSQQAILGELDGVYWLSGEGVVTAEDTLTDFGVSPQEEFIIFQMTFRTDSWMYFAVRKD